MGSLFSTLMSFIKSALYWFFELLYNGFIDIVNLIISALAGVFTSVISLLPGSSINFTIPSALQNILGYIAWFLPLSTMFASIAVFCSALLVYYGVRPILKFIQMM